MQRHKGWRTLWMPTEMVKTNFPRRLDSQTRRDAGSRQHARFVTGLVKSHREGVDVQRVCGLSAKTLTIRVLSLSCYSCVGDMCDTYWDLTCALSMAS